MLIGYHDANIMVIMSGQLLEQPTRISLCWYWKRRTKMSKIGPPVVVFGDPFSQLHYVGPFSLCWGPISLCWSTWWKTVRKQLEIHYVGQHNHYVCVKNHYVGAKNIIMLVSKTIMLVSKIIMLVSKIIMLANMMANMMPTWSNIKSTWCQTVALATAER